MDQTISANGTKTFTPTRRGRYLFVLTGTFGSGTVVVTQHGLGLKNEAGSVFSKTAAARELMPDLINGETVTFTLSGATSPSIRIRAYFMPTAANARLLA